MNDKPMTPDALEAIAREVGQVERRHCIGKAQGFDVRDGYSELRAAIEQYGKEQYARGVNDAWPAGRGSGEPIAMLHDDGHWTHPPGRDPLDRFSGKVRMEVYAAPQPREPLTDEQIARLFHDAYKRLAPTFLYCDSRTLDPESPNDKLMIAVLREVAHNIRSAG